MEEERTGWFTPGDSMRGWLRIGMPGELLYTGYAPVEVTVNDDDDNDDDDDSVPLT